MAPTIKGFAVRRRGRPAGSRAIDRGQSDFFPLEKIIAQGKAAAAAALLREQARGEAAPPATNRGGKFHGAEIEEGQGVKL